MRISSKVLAMTGVTTVLTMGISSFESNACGLGDVDFKVTASSLNVRVSPGKDSKIVGSLKKGAIVTPDRLSGDKTWGRIAPNKWVSMNYLEKMHTHSNENSSGNTSGEQSTPATKYIVTASKLNGREKPTTASRVITSFKKGTVLISTKVVGEWLEVEDGHIRAYVHSSYVKKASSTEQDNSNNKPSQKPPVNISEERTAMYEGVVTASSLNIRQRPSTDSPIVGSLKKGNTVLTEFKSGKWRKIDNGWIHEDYVKLTSLSINASTDNSEFTPLDGPGWENRQYKVDIESNSLLPVRYDKHSGSSVKYNLKSGTQVEVLHQTQDGWSRIKYFDDKGRLQTGYCDSQFLKKINFEM